MNNVTAEEIRLVGAHLLEMARGNDLGPAGAVPRVRVQVYGTRLFDLADKVDALADVARKPSAREMDRLSRGWRALLRRALRRELPL
jgi:hypothetical protein